MPPFAGFAKVFAVSQITWPRRYKTFLIYSTKLTTKFILLITVKMSTIVGILTFISMIDTTTESLKARKSVFCGILVFMSTQLS